MRRFLISFITLILTNIVYSQNDVVVSQPKCEDLKGYNFSGIKWVDKDGTYYPDFPINGIVKMCDDKGLITLEMLFVNGKSFRDRYWEKWGLRVRYYVKDLDPSDGKKEYHDQCFNKRGKKINCK
jgi:hypothetical protein